MSDIARFSAAAFLCVSGHPRFRACLAAAVFHDIKRYRRAA